MTTDTEALTYDHIVALALEHGFKLKPQVDGRMALNDYVIDFARAVYNIGHAAAKSETAAAVAKEREWANRSAHDLFLAAFDTYLDEVGVAGALSTATTIFVSLVVSYTKACGHDADRPITINGGENRDVTIHALKEGAASA